MKIISTKADETLAEIVVTALDIAMAEGIAQVSFGKVAKRLGMSKSGVFCRAGSLQSLQRAVLDEFDRRFMNEVVAPTRAAPRGLPALEEHVRKLALCGHGEVPQGPVGATCLYIIGALDGATLDPALRERLQVGLTRWRTLLVQLVKDAIELGQLPPDTNCEQLVFEVHSLVVGMAHDARFLRDPEIGTRMVQACRRLLASYEHEAMTLQ